MDTLKKTSFRNTLWLLCMTGISLSAVTSLSAPVIKRCRIVENWDSPKKYTGSLLSFDKDRVNLAMKQCSNGALSLWKSRGYGLIAGIDNDTLQLFASTQISTIPGDKLFMKDHYLFLDGFSPIGYEISDSVFIMKTGSGIIFDRIDSLPSVEYSDFSSNPRVNFDVLWYTFKENFPFFSLTGTNWDSVYSVYRPRVSTTTSAASLFSIFCEMLAPLHDGHSSIYDQENDTIYSPGPSLDYFWLWEWEQLIENVSHRLDDQEIGSTANGTVLFGKIDGVIGYVNILSMGGYSDEGVFIPDEIVIAHVMDSLIDIFSDCIAVIVDLRLNGGGNDMVAKEIASRFNDHSRIGYQVRYRQGEYDEFSTPDTIVAGTNAKNFGNKKVIVLTSTYTMSAAELFVLLMKDLPNVTLVGGHTYGIFSTSLGVYLPNGWEMNYSMQQVFSSENICYEQKGINPDVPVQIDSVAFFNGTDNILEQAIELTSTENSDNRVFRHTPNEKTRFSLLENNKLHIILPDDEVAAFSLIDLAGRRLAVSTIHGSGTVTWDSRILGTQIVYGILERSTSTERIRIATMH